MGHTHENVVKAISEQAKKLIHYTPAYFHHVPEIDLAQKLVEIAPGNSEKKWSALVIQVLMLMMQLLNFLEPILTDNTLFRIWALIMVPLTVHRPFQELV